MDNEDKDLFATSNASLESISRSLDDEEKRLFALEEERVRLSEGIEALLREISVEKELFRSAFGGDIAKRYEIGRGSLDVKEEVKFKARRKVDPVVVKQEDVDKCLISIQTKLNKINPKNDADINRLKSNLAQYEKTLLAPTTRKSRNRNEFEKRERAN